MTVHPHPRFPAHCPDCGARILWIADTVDIRTVYGWQTMKRATLALTETKLGTARIWIVHRCPRPAILSEMLPP